MRTLRAPFLAIWAMQTLEDFVQHRLTKGTWLESCGLCSPIIPFVASVASV